MTEKFEVHLDKIDDVIWLVLKVGASGYYDEVVPGINLEFEDDNSLMGIEILHASKFLSDTKKLKNSKTYYEPEDDVLNIYVSKKSIDYAQQYGDFIIHFSKNRKPVYVEILDYSKMLKDGGKIRSRKNKETSDQMQTSVSHRVK